MNLTIMKQDDFGYSGRSRGSHLVLVGIHVLGPTSSLACILLTRVVILMEIWAKKHLCNHYIFIYKYWNLRFQARGYISPSYIYRFNPC